MTKHQSMYVHGGIACVLAVVLVFIGISFSSWQFLLTVALAKGMVALGVVLLLRIGLASFGQGLFYCVGAYSVGMIMAYFGVREIVILLPLAVIFSAVLAWILGFMLSRYREIFFAMLSLALSMILFGLLVRNPALGGSDGFNVLQPTFLMNVFGGEGISRQAIFIMVATLSAVVVFFGQLFTRSHAGRLGPAIKDNEVRVEYLGASSQKNIHLAYTIAGGLAGLGGALSALTVGHVDPELAFWTTSGEFVFIAVLGGVANAYAPFVGAIVLEFIRSLAYQYAPNTWQIVMGVSMLALIVFLPGGLISLRKRLRGKDKNTHDGVQETV